MSAVCPMPVRLRIDWSHLNNILGAWHGWHVELFKRIELFAQI